MQSCIILPNGTSQNFLMLNYLTNSCLFGEETTGKDLGFLLTDSDSMFSNDDFDLYMRDLGNGRSLAKEDLYRLDLRILFSISFDSLFLTKIKNISPTSLSSYLSILVV